MREQVRWEVLWLVRERPLNAAARSGSISGGAKINPALGGDGVWYATWFLGSLLGSAQLAYAAQRQLQCDYFAYNGELTSMVKKYDAWALRERL